MFKKISRKDLFDHRNWVKALPLEDRLSISTKSNKNSHEYDELISQWSQLKCFSEGDFSFEERIAHYGVELNQLENYLNNCAPQKKDIKLFDWLNTLEYCYFNYRFESYVNIKDNPFAYFAEPVISYYINALEEKLESNNIPFNIKLITSNLCEAVENIATSSIVTEMHNCEVSNDVSENYQLDQFEKYISQFKCPEYSMAFLHKYPVLAYLLIQLCDQWLKAKYEMIERIHKDFKQIKNHFNLLSEFVDIVEVKSDAGDTHNNGRSVTIIIFKNGERLVYKPRCFEVDCLYNEILDWFNQSKEIELKKTKCLAFTDYGYAEFISHESLKTSKQIDDYYFALGNLLFIAYIFQFSDLHLDNLIANKNKPIIIDIETIMQPWNLPFTPFSTGLLPESYKNKDGEVKILGGSAFCGSSKDDFILKSHKISDKHTLGMTIQYDTVKFDDSENLPNITNKEFSPFDYTKILIKGFQASANHLINNKNVFINANFIDRLSKTKRRWIARPTAIYSTILNESLHPNILTDNLKRQQLFDVLFFNHKKNNLETVQVLKEIKCLQNLNIPMFHTSERHKGCELVTKQQIEEKIENISLDSVAKISFNIQSELQKIKTII